MPGLITGNCKSLKDTYTIDILRREIVLFVLSLQSKVNVFLPFLKDDMFKKILPDQTLFMFQESYTLSHFNPQNSPVKLLA